MEHDNHRQVKQIVAEFLREHNAHVWTEYRLDNGKIADVLAIDIIGIVSIFEVKTDSTKDYRHETWAKYGLSADYVSVVYSAHDGQLYELKPHYMAWSLSAYDVGVWRYDVSGLAVVRPAIHLSAFSAKREAQRLSVYDRIRLEQRAG